MSAFALLQTSFTPLELLLYLGGGLILFLWVASLFRRRKPPGPPKPLQAALRNPALDPIILAAEQVILDRARAKVNSAGIFHFGVVDISPEHLAYWITTKTDAERDRLSADAGLIASFRAALAEAGYPADAISRGGFAFESQETVDRVHDGNWWYAVK